MSHMRYISRASIYLEVGYIPYVISEIGSVIGCIGPYVPLSYFVPQVAVALIQGSEGDDSSATSSLRTEKPLERQKEWEVDHARARARRLREESRQEFDQELRVRTNAMLHNTQDDTLPEMVS